MEAADLLNQSAFLWASAPMRVGRHEWRIIVFNDDRYGPCTQYEFRGPNTPHWKLETSWSKASSHWPGYNGDHCHGGMPKSISRLYYGNREEIKELIPDAV